MTFEEKLGLSNVNHQIICKFILYLICNDWKQILRSETLKNLLKTFCDKNKGTRKKSFQSFLTRKFASLFNLYIVNNSLLHDYQTNVWIKRKNMLMENHQNQKCYIYIYIYTWHPVPPRRWGRGYFSGPVGGLPFHMDSPGLLHMRHMGGVKIRGFLGGTPVSTSCPIGKFY